MLLRTPPTRISAGANSTSITRAMMVNHEAFVPNSSATKGETLEKVTP